jgi:hypothetical protein
VSDVRTLEAILRNDFVSFVEKAFRGFHPGTELRLESYIRLICATLEKVEAGDLRRLAVTLPPRHLKSFLISVALPAWILGRDPTRKIMVISHDIVLAKELSKACRNIIKQRLFGKASRTRGWRATAIRSCNSKQIRAAGGSPHPWTPA